MPFIEKNKYKIFSFGKIYTVEEECIEKLKSLEEYREFIWDYKPYIILPLIIISSLLSGLICFFIDNKFDNIKQYTLWITLLLYIITSIVYYKKIRNAIECL